MDSDKSAPETQQKKMDKRTRLLVLGIGFAALAYAAGRLAHHVTESVGGDTYMTVVIIRSAIAVIAFIALGGVAWLRPSWRSIRETWSFAKPLIIINLVIGFFVATSVLSGLVNETIAFEDAVRIGGYVTVICFLVGVNEEVMFRGLVYGGLLAKLGGTSTGLLKAAVISSLVFGLMHVVFDVDYANFYSIGSGLLKTLETGMFAFIFCVPVVKGRNLWGAITAHGFFDWIVLCGNSIQNGGLSNPTYVSDNPTVAIAAMVIFGVLCLLYLPRTIRAYKELRSINEPQYGPFMR